MKQDMRDRMDEGEGMAVKEAMMRGSKRKGKRGGKRKSKRSGRY